MSKQVKSKEIETLYHKAKLFKTEAAIQVEARKLWDAEKTYSKAIDIYAELAKLAPSYRLEFTRLLNNAGNVSHELRQYSDAKKIYEKSLEIYHDLSREDPVSYQHNIAKTLNNLANVLVDLRDYTPARKTYEECLIIRRSLAETEPKSYCSELAKTLSNYATLHRAVREPSLARKNHEEALAIFKELNESDPKNYREDIARTLNSLGVVHSAQQNDELSKQAYQKALSIQRELAIENPQTYRSKVALTLTNLGNTLFDLRDFLASQKSFEEALAIRRDLATKDPYRYRPKVAKSLAGLGYVLYAQDQFFPARRAYKEALGIYREFAKTEPEVYLPSITRTLDDLARLLVDTGCFMQSQSAFEEAIHLAETQIHDGGFQSLIKQKIHAAYRSLLKISIQQQDYLKAFAYTVALRDGQARSCEVTPRDLQKTQDLLKQRNQDTGVYNLILTPTLGLNGELLVGLISSDKLDFYEVEPNAWDKLAPSEESSDNDNSQLYHLAQQLWEVLPEGIKEALVPTTKINSQVKISADPFWSAFPWELLRFGDGKLDYLGLHQVLPRIGAIHTEALKTQLNNRSPIMKNGNVTIFSPYDTDPNKPLLGAIVETNTIKKVIEGQDTLKLVAFAPGKLASEQEFNHQLDLYPDVFYFSGHGVIKDNEEYLKLHSSNNTDSFTYIGRQELNDLSKDSTKKLFPNRPLIVLNSCVTGRSRTAGGEREDLVAALIELGAGAVIASPILIQDMVSKAFGEALFHQLMKSYMSIGETVLTVRRELAKGICADANSLYWGIWGMIHIHGAALTSLSY